MSVRAAVALVAVLAAGCAGGHAGAAAHAKSHAAPSPSTSSTAVAPAHTDDTQLARALVRAGDLPAGYIKDTQVRGTTLAASSTDSACARRFAAVSRLRTTGVLAPLARAQVSFSKTGDPHFIRAAAFRYRDAQTATKIVTAVHDVFTSCRTFTATDPASKRVVSVSLLALPFPHLGDGGTATDGTLTSAGRRVYVDLVFVHTGRSIAYVAGLTSGHRDLVALQRAVRAEVTRLSAR